MYLVERYMKILKGYVKNQYQPKASIVERYITEEVIKFCSGYIPSCESIGIPKTLQDERCEGKGTRNVKIRNVCKKKK